MPCGALVELARRGSVLPGRDDSGFSRGGERRDHARVGIVGFVGDQQVGGHLRQHGVGPDEIVNLARGQEKAQRVAEGVGQGVDLKEANALLDGLSDPVRVLTSRSGRGEAQPRA